MKKTIVFGTSGFLGSVFLRQYPELVSAGRTAPEEGIDNRHIHIPNMDSLYLLDDEEIDNVIFLIGNSNHHMLNSQGMAALEYNVIPMKKALHYFSKRKLEHFVFFTTILLYGIKSKGRPVHEQDEVFPYTNEYIFSKHLAEETGRYYAKQGMNIVNVRISNIYGATSLSRPDLVPQLILDALTKKEVTVWNDAPCRDFIFAEDACEAVMELLNTHFSGVVNLGTGTSHTVRELCDIISELSGKKIISLNKEVTGVPEFTTDMRLMQSLIPWHARHTLREGLEKAFETMKRNLPIY